jgi:hypothetical protein
MAGILSWRYIEIVPSLLMADGVEKTCANLREVMEDAKNLDEVVLLSPKTPERPQNVIYDRWLNVTSNKVLEDITQYFAG